MSRVSRKSELSPSITKSSNGIDLGKNSGVDMGRKSEPSLTSGGIGIRQEVTNIGGMSVRGGVEVDLTPVDFGINIDSDGTVSIATGAEVPGGLLGVSGGIEIDLNTGEVIGGSIGAEIGGLGINLSNSEKGGLGIEFTVQIPGTPIELSLGFGFPPKKEPTPTPTPTPDVPPPPTSVTCSTGSWRVGGYGATSTGNANTFLEGSAYLEHLIVGTKSEFDYYTTGWDEATAITQANRIWGINKWTKTETEVSAYFPQRSAPNPPVPSYVGEWYYQTLDGRINYGGDRRNQHGRFWMKGMWNCTLPLYKANNNSGQFYGVSYNWRSNLIEVLPAPPCPLTPTPTPTPSPSPSPSPSPFPNPPPRRQNKMDACCRENLKFLRAIYTRLGLYKFPGSLPATIIQEVSKEGEAPAEPPQVPIADFVDLLDWQFRRDDERWGQWEIQINVKDADLTKEGDQGKSIKFPNLAESIAELEGQMLSVMANVDALVAITTKNLVESGMARQEAIKGYLAAKAIIKYMAFKSTEIDVPVPMTFTAGAETISALVQESEGHIKGTDYLEKETLRDIWLDLLQAAAVTRAVHWQKIDSKNDTKTQLLNLLKNTVDLAGVVANPKKSTDGEEKKFDPAQNFEDFIDSAEDGFRNTTGITDIENPYGKTPDRRPRIRQIGDNISQAGGNN